MINHMSGSAFIHQVTVSMAETRIRREGIRREDGAQYQTNDKPGKLPNGDNVKPAFCQSWISLEQRYQRL